MKLRILAALLLLTGSMWAAKAGPSNITAANATCSATSCLSYTFSDQPSAVVITVTGTWVATLQFEGIAADGTTIVSVTAMPIPASTSVTSATANGTWTLNVAGLSGVQVRCSAFTSGTAVASIATSSNGVPIGTNVAATVSLAANSTVDMNKVAGTTTSVNNGTVDAGTQRVAVASDNTPFQSIPVTTAATTNTASSASLQSAASTNATSVKGSAGNIYGTVLVNTTTTIYYLRLYNLASAPTCSSATGFVRTVPIPPASAAGGAAGIVVPESFGEAFATGIAYCLTGGGSSTDNTNAATGVFVTIFYK